VGTLSNPTLRNIPVLSHMAAATASAPAPAPAPALPAALLAEKDKVLSQLADLVGAEPEGHELDGVLVDGLVMLKIMKHTKENVSDLVLGQLVGLEVGRTLQVTDAFPFPPRSEESEENVDPDADPTAEYQWEMMKCLREVNVDSNIVGWYQTSYLGSFVSASMLETQFTYQSAVARSVLLLYDPVRTKQGALSLRAFRLSRQTMELFRAGGGALTPEQLSRLGISFQELLEELPVSLRNSALASAFLYELETIPAFAAAPAAFDRLDLSASPFLEKNLEFLIEYLDDLAVEQAKFQAYQRNVQRQEAMKAQYLQKRV
jgi:translation initiation factor 3 subunit H